MPTQELPPHSDIDIVDKASMQSFPASDAPSWAIGQSHRPAPSALGTESVVLASASPTRKEEARHVRGNQHEHRAPVFP
jgi:hypothetical protein